MSYNIKDGSYGTDDQSATQRKNGLAKTIALKNPEIVCLQESNQLSASALASACASNGTRTYSVYQQHHTAVMWDPALFTKLANGSVDCTVPEGEGGDGYTRICTWVKLKRNADDEIFYVVSAHFDLNTPGTSAATLTDYISANFEGLPTVIAGDLNANEARWVNIGQFKGLGYTNANTAYTDFLSANHITGGDAGWNDRVSGTAADNGLAATFPKNGNILDWCYYTTSAINSGSYEVVSSTVTWSYSYESLSYPHSGSCTANPSDHYPIYLKIAFR